MSERHNPNLLVEFALLGLLAALWGSAYLLTKIAVTEIPPVTLIASRVVIATIFLVIVALSRGDRMPRDPGTWGRFFIQAVFNSIGAWTLLAWGQQYVGSGLASVLNSTSPIFVFLIILLFTRNESVSWFRLTGAVLGVSGVILIVGPDVLDGLGQQTLAQLAILLSALLYSGAAIFGKNFSHLPATITAVGTMIWATLCLVPASVLLDEPWRLSPSLLAIGATLVLGVFSTGAALLIYFRLVRTLGSMGVASQSYLRAGVGVLLGIVVLGERLTPNVSLGLVCALLGVAAINTPDRKPVAQRKPS